MATVEVKYTMEFDDKTTQDVTIGPFASNYSMTNLKDNIIDFNNNFDSDTAQIASSKYGNKWKGISRARVITTNITNFI